MAKTKRSQRQQEIGIGAYLFMPSLFKQKNERTTKKYDASAKWNRRRFRVVAVVVSPCWQGGNTRSFAIPPVLRCKSTNFLLILC